VGDQLLKLGKRRGKTLNRPRDLSKKSVALAQKKKKKTEGGRRLLFHKSDGDQTGKNDGGGKNRGGKKERVKNRIER